MLLFNFDICKDHNKIISFRGVQINRTPFQYGDFRGFFFWGGGWALENNKLSSQKTLRLKAAIYCHVIKTVKFVYVFEHSWSNYFLKYFVLPEKELMRINKSFRCINPKASTIVQLLALSKIIFCSDAYVLCLCCPIYCGFSALKMVGVTEELNCI